jgi:hypothetical protein
MSLQYHKSKSIPQKIKNVTQLFYFLAVKTNSCETVYTEKSGQGPTKGCRAIDQ